MSHLLSIETTASTAAEMKEIGRALGRAIRVGDVVGLTGPLGAGKTTLAQGIAAGLEVAADRHVASPTFALVNEHPARVPFVHADFYRLRDQAELIELGLDEIFERAAVVIEWVDLFPTAVPTDHVHIEIKPAADGTRVVAVRGNGDQSSRLVHAIAQTRSTR